MIDVIAKKLQQLLGPIIYNNKKKIFSLLTENIKTDEYSLSRQFYILETMLYYTEGRKLSKWYTIMLSYETLLIYIYLLL